MRLMLGDSADRLAEVATGSVQLVVTSPPYDGIREYLSGARFDFGRIAQELHRVLCPGGVVIWVVGDQVIDGSESGTSFRQALGFKDVGFRLHDTMLYHKKNPVPLANHRRYQQCFEYMFCFSKGRPRVANLLREPCKEAGGHSEKVRRHRKGAGDQLQVMSGSGRPVLPTKARTNLWSYGSGGRRVDHPAVFPIALARDQILSWSDPGDVVLDPFLGSGTTAIAADETGREFVGIERDPTYLAVARAELEASRRSRGLQTDPTPEEACSPGRAA